MNIRIKENSVVIEGYVNAVERSSKPLYSRFGEFIEKIVAGAFGRALKRNDDVRILLNHNPERDLGGTGSGELELTEDSIGLHARAIITDEQVINDAKHNNLVGWSFGFADREVEILQDSETGLPLRRVKDLDLFEVSILNREKTPAYNGTLVEVRDNGDKVNLGENNEPEKIETIDETVNGLDETTAEALEEIRAEDNIEAEATPAEATTDDTKSYDNSKYKNIITELEIIRDSVKNY
jgi:HK97 family phage prohead protease